MNGNTELLNYIYQNSQMGIETLNQLIQIVKNKDFNDHLRTQLKEYESLNKEALSKLKELGHEEKSIGTMVKISAYMSISMKTMMDNSPSHIAEMLIQGSTMGIIDATKNIQKYKDADKEILALTDKILKTEQNNIDQLKGFLG